MIRALVTRPAEDSADLVRALEARGISVTVEPLLTIKTKDGVSVDTAGVQALLFTSANGVRNFASASLVRDIPSFAVGDATAETLRKLGFAKVESAGGDVEDLEKLVREKLKPADGKLLHAAGSSVAGDLAGRLKQAGFEVDRVQLYDAEPADALTDKAKKEIAEGRIDWVLAFSPRTAATFAEVIGRAKLEGSVRGMTLIALSDAVAKAAPLPFKQTVVAAEPTQAALLARVDALLVEAPTKDAAAPAQRRMLPVLVGAGVVLALVAGAVLLSRPQPTTVAIPPATQAPSVASSQVPIAAPAPQSVDLSPILQRLDRIDTALAALGQRVDGVAAEAQQAGAKAVAAAEAAASRPADSSAPVPMPPPVDLGPIERKLTSLEQSIAEVSRRAAIGVETERRLAEVERMAKADRRLDAAAIAAIKIGDALAAGRPYKAELALLAGMPGIDAELKLLSAKAETGIPSRAALIERFPAAAALAARTADHGDDVWNRTLAKLQGLVQVRKLAPGDDLDGRLARAEILLKGGDLAGALAALDGLPDGAVRALSVWRADAEARLEAERALDRATQALAAGLGRAG